MRCARAQRSCANSVIYEENANLTHWQIQCRTQASRPLLACCPNCDKRILIPYSCGHRLCLHCQHFESERWRLHQRVFYDALMSCAWQTVKQFSLDPTPVTFFNESTGLWFAVCSSQSFYRV